MTRSPTRSLFWFSAGLQACGFSLGSGPGRASRPARPIGVDIDVSAWGPQLSAWLDDRAPLVWWLGAVSIVTFVGSLMLVPWLIVRIPPEYFVNPDRPTRARAIRHPVLRAFFLIAKNLLGAALILSGISMLILPGQGLLTILVGAVLANYPGKFKVERWIVTRPRIFKLINRLRSYAGHAPLSFE